MYMYTSTADHWILVLYMNAQKVVAFCVSYIRPSLKIVGLRKIRIQGR